MKDILPIVAGFLVLLSPVIYIRSMLDGVSKPHRTTQFVITIITTLSFTGLVSDSQVTSIWLAGGSMIQALVIFVLSFRYGMGGRSTVDMACLLIALLGVVLWQRTSSPLVALYASLIADFIGCIPSIVKTYKLPHTEDWRYYAIDSVAGFLVMVSLVQFSVSAIAYPLYIVLINTLMVILATRTKRVCVEIGNRKRVN